MGNEKEVPTIPKEYKEDPAYTALKTAFNVYISLVAILIAGMIGVMAIMFQIYTNFDSKIASKVEDKFKDQVFINKLAEEIRFPFVVFDEKIQLSLMLGQ